VDICASAPYASKNPLGFANPEASSNSNPKHPRQAMRQVKQPDINSNAAPVLR
jgi:hypothetical protein